MNARIFFMTAMLCLATVAAAGDLAYDQEAAQAAWAKAGTPGPVHVFLAELAGDWDVAGTMWMEPGAEPTTSKSHSHADMVMGGRYLDEFIRGEYMGMAFEGKGVTGYDNTTHTITSVWWDNTGTALGVMKGVYEKVGEPMELFGTMVDPMSGTEIEMRSVTTFEGPDQHRMESYMTMRGLPEMKVMELVYTRR